MFSGLIGTLFVNNKEPAFAAHKMCQALGAFALFMTAPYLCTKMKVILVGCVLLVAAAGYIALEAMLRVEKKRMRGKKRALSSDNHEIIVGDKTMEIEAVVEPESEPDKKEALLEKDPEV